MLTNRGFGLCLVLLLVVPVIVGGTMGALKVLVVLVVLLVVPVIVWGYVRKGRGHDED